MTDKQQAMAKGFVLGALAKKHSNLTKSYFALGAAAVYAIRAAKEYNAVLEEELTPDGSA